MTALTRLGWFLAALVCLLGLVSCGGSARGNKAGAGVKQVRTLVLEVPDDNDPQAAAFTAAAGRRSHGSLRVDHDTTAPYTSAVPANELRLAHALESGKVQIGYLPARAWALEGLPDFQALLAPFVLSTELAARSFARSPLADAVLRSLPKSVVGLALVPTEARRILANRPLTAAASFIGLRVRIIDNPQTASDLRALGARPVLGLTASAASDALNRQKLDAVESSPSNILSNGYMTHAKYLSAFSPFAKFETIVVSRAAWDKLSAAQQEALRAAAHDALAAAIRDVPSTEQQELTELCQAGVVFSRPSAGELAAMASAAELSFQGAFPDAAGDELMSQLLKLPGTGGVQALATPVPAACSKPGQGSVPTSGRIPNGVYRVTISYADWLKGNVINPDMRRAITYVTTMKDGRWYQTQTPNYPDQGPFSGTYSVHGDELTWIMLRAGVHGQNSITAPETVKWSYYDGQLTLQNLIVADSGSRVLYAAHPWRKIR